MFINANKSKETSFKTPINIQNFRKRLSKFKNSLSNINSEEEKIMIKKKEEILKTIKEQANNLDTRNKMRRNAFNMINMNKNANCYFHIFVL